MSQAVFNALMAEISNGNVDCETVCEIVAFICQAGTPPQCQQAQQAAKERGCDCNT